MVKNWYPSFEPCDGKQPTLNLRLFQKHVPKKGTAVPICLANHAWSETSQHLIVLNVVESGIPIFDVVLPAKIIGKLLLWLRGQANSSKVPWQMVKFWLYRSNDDEWAWFMEESPEAACYLPWKVSDGVRMAAEIMNS